MPRDITITFADGSRHVYRGAPDDVTPQAVQARAQQEFGKAITSMDGGRKAAPEKAAPPSRMDMLKDEALTSLPGAFLRGAKDIVDTGAEYLSRLGGDKEAARVKEMNDAGDAEFSRAVESTGNHVRAGVGRVSGNIAATLPVGGVLAVPAKALGATRLANALRTGGFVTGAPAATTIGGRAADLGIRMAGGGATGYASAGLVDQDSANTGGVIGTLLPPVAKVTGAAGNAVSSLVRPFTSGGQEQIAGSALRQFASNPDDALRNLRNPPEMVPGSMPTAVEASGDVGLAGLSRTLQSADPRYANEVATRLAAQNKARTVALEEVAGNTGKLSIARTARDEATDAMRETVLDAAGQFPARPVLDSIDRLIASPNNAGKLAQSALRDFRARIAEWSPDGQINARALYEIRKDIDQVLGGKLQGEAGNLRYASGQLIKVKELIDDAIDKASRRVEMSSSRAVMPYGANIERAGMAPPVSAGPRPTWQGYLGKYREMSIPINQMEALEEVLRAVKTGATMGGEDVISAAKLNTYLRNNAKELQKKLSPEQLNLLRRLEADLNASAEAATAGKALGSNTVQNISGVNALASVLGQQAARSSPVQSTVGRAVNWIYKKPDAEITNKLVEALLDPKEAARLMATPEGNALMRALNENAARIGYRAAPALSAQ